MKKTAFFMIVAAAVYFGLFAGSAYAAGGNGVLDAGHVGFANGKNNKIVVSHPERNAVVSGYFIPVSWRDTGVENSSQPYPDNYMASGKSYRVMVLDKGGIVLEKIVTGLNYCVFTIKDVKDVLEKKAYQVKVEAVESFSVSPPVRFVYEKPDLDDAVLKELEKLGAPGEDGAETEDGQFTSLDNAYAALNTSSYTSCPTCYSNYWPGMVVFYIRYATTYQKTLYIYCGSDKYYEKTVAADFTGPVFVSMMSGYNYSAIYYDRLTLSNQCINIKPFEYTWVLFP